ncbi:MAG TPA: PepSY domain-containing protein, partial [Rhodobacteraceae bacterium]|nr:PepSY domain-containing protein [Paracoccaceae bacterium]
MGMIKRIVFLLVLALATPVATGAFANPFADSAVSQLRQQGFQEIVIKRTLLGRIKIRATQSESVREIIIHPVTGEVLRDYWIVYAGKDGGINTPPPA